MNTVQKNPNPNSCFASKGDCNTMEKSTSDELSTAAVVS
ncbi:hypothetical protein T03_17737 [Trichinella britovi]|uniref:Uncharacterized protein n=1 Tax=Trichinella britovi TaxID=45882 RepID=A0A0V0YRS9_TRIBR|nr:hypothetical protein T03_17737 [Trichinella britovi]